MSEMRAPQDFGQVDPDGTVYVIVGDEKRAVGQIPDAAPEEALAFYVRRFENLAAEIALLDSRINSRSLPPEDARKAIASAKQNVASANAVGDLASLTNQLGALEELLPAQIEERKQARAEQNAATLEAKQAMVAEAEELAKGNDWRGGVDRFRTLLEEWKALPRIDRTTDNELWHRFSSARTTYTRRRKAHFSELNTKRDQAKAVKEQLIAEAEPLAKSTDWGPTSGAFRDLMDQWKAAGSARRADDEALWTRFRAIQDEFFTARNAANSQAESEQTENLAAKNDLVAQARADLEATSEVESAKHIHRDFLDKFNALGHVPRHAMRELDSRVRALGKLVSDMEAEEWRRTDPEARKRAEDTVALFQQQVTKLSREREEAEAAGDNRKLKDITKSLETYTSWLEQAQETLAEFQG